MVSTTVYGDDDLDDADCDSGLAEGEVMDVVCCGLLAVSVLVRVLRPLSTRRNFPQGTTFSFV